MDVGAEAGARLILGREGLRQLMCRLAEDDREIIGPTVRGGAVILGTISSPDDLPVGASTEQDAAPYRLFFDKTSDGATSAAFDHGAPAFSWKRYLYPSNELLSRLRREPNGFSVDPEPVSPSPAYVLFGMRPCDLRALQALDAALGTKGAADVRYIARREQCLVVVVNCTRSTAACFCASMNTGPRATAGYDLSLTELVNDGGVVRYVVSSGSARGAALLDGLADREATADDLAQETAAIEEAKTAQHRRMVPDVASLLQRNLDHGHWDRVAQRCLGCANCTLVCPTCFCTTVEDTTSLSGDVTERWRKWDSCFTDDFSYIHGGSIRRSRAARYRQWMTHKLSFWWQQFEMSGCVGCGRCITWCPVGIDITEEARAIHDSEAQRERDSDRGAAP